MIIIRERKAHKPMREGARYTDIPSALIVAASTYSVKVGPMAYKPKKEDVAEAIQLICGIATVVKRNVKLTSSDLYKWWLASRFDAAWRGVYNESTARELAFDILGRAGSLAALGF